MAWHQRHVAPVNTEKSPRITVVFNREDLLWTPSENEVVLNPYTQKETDIPFKNADGALIGPNIFDVIKRVERTKKDLKALGLPEKDEDEGNYLVLRPVTDFFEKPKKIKNKKTNEKGKDYLLYPFKKSLSTAGAIVGEGKTVDSFILVRKKSTVSISKLVFFLASGMYGSSENASAMIASVASDAWTRDLTRAKQLFQMVQSSKHGIHEKNIPSSARASSTISQEVETLILREACSWMGINPDQTVKRKRGRPVGKTGADTDENSHAGNVLVIKLSEDGIVTGSLLVDFAGYRKGTGLETLDLRELASILVELQDAEEVIDAELMEAFLEAADPDWRDKIISDSDDIGGFSSDSGNDPYAVLGVDRNATLEEVTKAYRKAMQRLHPDRSGLPEFFAQEVVKAYKTLKETFNE